MLSVEVTFENSNDFIQSQSATSINQISLSNAAILSITDYFCVTIIVEPAIYIVRE